MDILELSKDESDALGAAVTRVSQLYEIPLMSEKAMAWLNLSMVMGSVYGTRFMVASMQSKQAKQNVVDMPSPFQTGTN